MRVHAAVFLSAVLLTAECTGGNLRRDMLPLNRPPNTAVSTPQRLLQLEAVVTRLVADVGRQDCPEGAQVVVDGLCFAAVPTTGTVVLSTAHETCEGVGSGWFLPIITLPFNTDITAPLDGMDGTLLFNACVESDCSFFGSVALGQGQQNTYMLCATRKNTGLFARSSSSAL
jgi:hypothetical protein